VLPIFSGPNQPLFDSINKFEKKQTHAAIIYENNTQAKRVEEFAQDLMTKMREDRVGKG